MAFNPSVKQISTRSPQQQGLQGSIINNALSMLNNQPQAYNPEAIADKARSDFNSKTIPTLSERFASSSGNKGSSAFTNAIGQAGSGLEQSLAALRSQYGLQQQGQQNQFLSNLLGYGLQPSTENLVSPEQGSFWESLLGGASQGIGSALSFLPMLLGASTGGASNILSQIFSLLGNKNNNQIGNNNGSNSQPSL